MFLKPKKEEQDSFDKELYDKKKLTKPIKEVGEKWKLLPAFIKTRGLQKQHIDSFNHFIEKDLPKILETNKVVRPESDSQYFWEYVNIKVTNPTKYQDMRSYKITPQECRLRDVTYSADILVDVRYTKGRKLVLKKDIPIGRMPIMLQSCRCHLSNKSESELAEMGECALDPGGYFILKGVEKVLLIQEQQSKNRIFVDLDKNKDIQATCTSSTHEMKSKTTIFAHHKKFYLKHNVFLEAIPVFILFRAMGIENDMELIQFIGTDKRTVELLVPSLSESDSLNVFTQEMALKYIGKKIKPSKKVRHLYGTILSDSEQAREILAKVILCHVRVVKYNYKMKIVFLCLMLRKMIAAIDDPDKHFDDKDYYGNKRLELAGGLLSLLFEDLFKSYNADLRRTADNILSKKNRGIDFDITHHMEGMNKITRGMANAIQSGNWNIRRFKMERAGVTQVLSRLSFISTLGHMTRINSQFEKTRKVSGPRALQPSQWGILCPSDTPEGESCGLIKNLALLSNITTEIDEDPIIRTAYDLGVEDIELVQGEEIGNKFVVFVNGLPIGIHSSPNIFLKEFKILRRKGRINEFVSIYKNELNKFVVISTDEGRLCRPLIIVNNGIPAVKKHHLEELEAGIRKFDDFLKEGLIEYLDVNEENNSFIAIKEKDIIPKTTHIEIEPFTILGVCVGLVPYPHHNQSPRNTYQCAMGKQAMGAIAYNQFNRIDTLLYLVCYPQKPLVKTKTIDLINWEKIPAGQNAIVAVMGYSGYDIEDAMVISKASLDRGYGRCMVMKKIVTTFQTYGNQTKDMFKGIQLPPNMPPSMKKKFENFKRLDLDGLTCEGERVYPNEIVVRKIIPTITEGFVENQKVPYKEVFEKYKGIAPAKIAKVIISSSDEHETIVKTLIRSTRRPELGDKFSSRHGQKGVCGLIVEQDDMPFNDDGVNPDMIMNPHGYPSRMTVGKMIELINGKSGIVAREINGKVKGRGRLGYGTAFGGDKIEFICEKLIENGYSYSGKDYLTSGVTGEGLQAYIFHGPIYYQKLKHMVLDKVHARSRGPKAGLTRQPTVGRSRDGGLRFGEMERDCLVSYGSAYLLLERFLHSSDATEVSVCNKCGFIGYRKYCHYCKSSNDVHNIQIPYACKLLFQELHSMNIFPKMTLK